MFNDKAKFKFEIGDTVKHVAQGSCDEKTTIRFSSSEVRYFICERMMQECPGGIQKHYTTRPVLKGGVGKDCRHIQFLEIELVKSEPFKEE